ncbi:hypothetical protein RFI_18593 [Reticulomyxa filosa]|uniref:JmjC domain-containing protein n=1 Tax=Reticulomyxa filosa TaxID=46433 RepID=X6MYF7_RETFI|nr:hypothetical protein RFI_18593 [Reticulomyxa filosa]|eukprot:ETO18668.1 hypothetical protein RFI_18593 [Reticulomyxa filosa]
MSFYALSFEMNETLVRAMFNEDKEQELLRQLSPTFEQYQNTKLWLGTKSTVSKYHFDGSDNFNLQLFGQKRFQLMPPSMHWDANVYPWIHPQSRKTQNALHPRSFGKAKERSSQVHKKNDDDDDSGGGSGGGEEHRVEYQVILSPGEMLYIPPFWFHQVIGETDVSINVNVWSVSEEGRLQDHLLTYPLPMDADDLKDSSYLLLCLKQYCHELVQQYIAGVNGSNVTQWASRYVQSRFHLLGFDRQDQWKQVLRTDSLESFAVAFRHTQQVCDVLEHSSPHPSHALFQRNLDDNGALLKQKYHSYAKQVVDERLRQADYAVGEILLGAYIEIIVDHFLQTDMFILFLNSASNALFEGIIVIYFYVSTWEGIINSTLLFSYHNSSLFFTRSNISF